MENDLNRYFADELTPEEKDKLFLKVSKDEELQTEFIDNQQIIALVDWQYSKNDEELAKTKLVEFMRRMENAKRK